MRKPTLSSDQERFLQIEKGQEKAAADLLMQHKDQLYYTAYLLVKDRYLAEDIFQEASIKVFRSIRKGNYAEEGKFVPWVARIVRNLCIDHIRQAKKRMKVTMADGSEIFDFLDSGRRNQEEEIILKQSCTDARALLSQIPYTQREVVVLRIYGGMSFKQIAEVTNSGMNTVLGRMRYGLINMKKILESRNILL